VGFKTSGLAGAGAIVQINNGSDLIISKEGNYTFAVDLREGAYFELQVKQQPTGPNQLCTFSKLSGEIYSNVDLILSCENVKYSVGGTLIIDANRISQLSLAVNDILTDIKVGGTGDFQFAGLFDDNLELQITFAKLPDFQSCTINGEKTYTIKVAGKTLPNLQLIAYTPLL